MSRNLQFYPTPVGAQLKRIEEAPLAKTRASLELVPDHASDAFFFRSIERMKITLNEPQIAAVRHLSGPALCLAGAGSGKTSVLTSRVGYLISVHKVHHKNILLMTFTQKAAEEMRDRIARLPGITSRMAKDITAGTFHSVFLKLLRSRGYDQKILSMDWHKYAVLKNILKALELQDAYDPESLLALLSSYKCRIIGVDEVPTKTPPDREMKEIFTRYEEWKRDNNYMDFDDMLFETLQLLRQDGRLLNSMRTRFKYILCDEWQDTNPLQYALIQLIISEQQNLFVVGDPNQCIYSFNGADVTILNDFDQDFPQTKVYRLNINYRSSASIVGLGNKIIEGSDMRHKNLLEATKPSRYLPQYLRPNTTDDEARLIVADIRAAVSRGERKYSDFAILYRTASSSRAMFEQLVLEGVPFVAFGKSESFYDQPIVKPVIDHLRLSFAPKSIDAIGGILPSLYLNRDRGISHIQAQDFLNPKDKPILHIITLSGLKTYQKQRLFDRIKMIDGLKGMNPEAAVQEIRKSYDSYIEADARKSATLHKEMIKEALSEVESSAKRFNTVPEFLAFIDLITQKNKEMEKLQNDPEIDAIHSMSIHKSKGLEYPVVYLTGASETILPHSCALEADKRGDMVSKQQGDAKVAAAIEEERRLAYVAVTRAKEELKISSPSIYRGETVEVSRFLVEAFATVKCGKQIPMF